MSSYHRIHDVFWRLLFLAAGLATVPLTYSDATAQTRILSHDKNGLTRADRHPEDILAAVEAGARLTIEFAPSRVFDFGAVDLPTNERVHAVFSDPVRFFVFPQDAYLLFGDPLDAVTGQMLITRQHPGPTSVFVLGDPGLLKLRLSRFSLEELNGELRRAVQEALPQEGLALAGNALNQIIADLDTLAQTVAITDPAAAFRSSVADSLRAARALGQLVRDLASETADVRSEAERQLGTSPSAQASTIRDRLQGIASVVDRTSPAYQNAEEALPEEPRETLRTKAERIASSMASLTVLDRSPYEHLLALRRRSCAGWNSPALSVGGRIRKHDLLDRTALRRSSLAPADSGWNLYEFEDVSFDADAGEPYVLVELIQYLEGSDRADLRDELLADCDPSTRTELEGVDSGRFGIVASMVLVKVAREFESAQLRVEVGGRRYTRTLEAAQDERGVVAASTEALQPGDFSYRICYQPTEDSGIRRLAPGVDTWCVPREGVRGSVLSDLPGSVRIQPGVVAVNRARDVRLTTHRVFIMDRSAYFGRRNRWKRLRFFGGVLNPGMGFQLGGSESQIVLLIGGHIRIIDQATFTFGLRFGNSETSEPYRLDQNFYFGFALDPVLFGRLRSTPATTQEQ
jgi:hypothetical protein